MHAECPSPANAAPASQPLSPPLAHLWLAAVTDWCAKAMCWATLSRSSSDSAGTSAKKRWATLTSASSDQGWNLWQGGGEQGRQCGGQAVRMAVC